MSSGQQQSLRKVRISLARLASMGSRGAHWTGESRVPVLDTQTGHMYGIRVSALKCAEGHGDPDDLSDAAYDDMPVARGLVGRAEGGRYVKIPRWSHSLSDGPLILEEVRGWLNSIGIDPID